MVETPVIVGKISGVYGVKGWVKVYSHTEPRENILGYSPWYIKVGNNWQRFDVVNGRQQAKTLVAQLEGLNDRNKAYEFIGCTVAINESQLKPLAEEEFYWRDLEGLEVVNRSAQPLGKVSHLIETGANDVLVVKTTAELVAQGAQKQLMIPYVPEQVVLNVDLDKGVIEVDWEHDY